MTTRVSAPTIQVLLQPRVLCFGLLKNGDVGISVFPEGGEILVSRERADESGVAICPL